MGLTSRSFQLSSTTLCEHHCGQERELRKTRRLSISVPSHKRLLGKLSRSADSRKAPHFPCSLWCHKDILAETCFEPDADAAAAAAASFSLHDRKDSFCSPTRKELNGYDECTASNPSDAAPTWPDDVHNEHDVHDVRMASKPSDAATTRVDGALNETSEPFASNSPNLPSDGVPHAGKQQCTARNPSNAATDLDGGVVRAHGVFAPLNPSKAADLPSGGGHHDAKGHDTCSIGARHDATTSVDPSNAGETEGKGEVRRLSLNEPGLLKTLQKARALTPLEQENLDLIRRFKLTNNNVQGQLVIQAVRTDQLRDLENLLTNSYLELMWGPFAYRPVLAWILSTYLREREAHLPHAVTLVGLYAPSEETNDPEVSSHKWWLAGAVEISFDASGKPKDMQTPVPPEGAPFLSNMAVLKNFRRRGIGRELLRAAEQLAVQMGGNEMYLHCRMIDEAPLNMYKKSGYAIVETDSILSLLLFQRRRHLMYKTLAAPLHGVTMGQLD